jgi:hypothetical protein
MSIIEKIHDDYIHDIEYHGDAIHRATDRYETWRYIAHRLPDMDFCKKYWTRVYDKYTLELSIPWDIAVADKIGKELVDNGWSLNETIDREPSGNTAAFIYVLDEEGFDDWHMYKVRVYKVRVIMQAYEYITEGQTCKLIQVGEEVVERVKPIYKIECEDPAPIP